MNPESKNRFEQFKDVIINHPIGFLFTIVIFCIVSLYAFIKGCDELITIWNKYSTVNNPKTTDKGGLSPNPLSFSDSFVDKQKKENLENSINQCLKNKDQTCLDEIIEQYKFGKDYSAFIDGSREDRGEIFKLILIDYPNISSIIVDDVFYDDSKEIKKINLKINSQ